MSGQGDVHSKPHVLDDVAAGQAHPAEDLPGECHAAAGQQARHPQPGKSQRPDDVLELDGESRERCPPRQRQFPST